MLRVVGRWKGKSWLADVMRPLETHGVPATTLPLESRSWVAASVLAACGVTPWAPGQKHATHPHRFESYICLWSSRAVAEQGLSDSPQLAEEHQHLYALFGARCGASN